MESVVQFPNGRGETLRGMLHSPESSTPTTRAHLVVFPNGGVMGSEGDYRAHTTIARHLTAGGYHVLRFSPAGLGYSDGHVAECPQKNLYASIENGQFVQDTVAAVEFACTLRSFATITLSGICGGAITSFLAAAQIKRVDSVIPIGVPVILDSEDMDYSARLPADEARLVLKGYLGRVLSPTAWRRLLSRKSEVGKIAAAVSALFRRKGAYMSEGGERGKFAANPLFFEAASTILRRRKPVLFVFGDADGFWWEFERLFLKRRYPDVDALPFDIYRSPRANHMLSMAEMQLDVSRAMLAWMARHHADPS